MQDILTAATVHHYAADLLLTHFALNDQGRSCPAQALLTVVFAAGARLTALSAAALGLRRAPAAETVRQALLANLPELALSERRCNRALRAGLPKRGRRRQRRAIDLTRLPYHGQPFPDDDERQRGQVKSGTTHFHAYATASLIQRGQRVTAALSYVRQGDDRADVLKRLLRTASQAGVRPALLLRDRGSYAVGVFRYPPAARRPFLLPVPLRGRKADHPKGPGGPRVFAQWQRSGFSRHRLTGPPGRTAPVGICVHGRRRRGRRGQHGRERLVYAYWGWPPPAPARVSGLYRARFGIETSYRQLNQGRARTGTRRPGVRLFLAAVASLLRNGWVWLHWVVLAGQRRGRRRPRLAVLTLKALLHMLWQVAGERLGDTDEARAERPIPDRLRT